MTNSQGVDQLAPPLDDRYERIVEVDPCALRLSCPFDTFEGAHAEMLHQYNKHAGPGGVDVEIYLGGGDPQHKNLISDQNDWDSRLGSRLFDVYGASGPRVALGASSSVVFECHFLHCHSGAVIDGLRSNPVLKNAIVNVLSVVNVFSCRFDIRRPWLLTCTSARCPAKSNRKLV